VVRDGDEQSQIIRCKCASGPPRVHAEHSQPFVLPREWRIHRAGGLHPDLGCGAPMSLEAAAAGFQTTAEILLEHMLREFHARGRLAGRQGAPAVAGNSNRGRTEALPHGWRAGKKLQQGTDCAIQHRLIVRLRGHLQRQVIKKRFPRRGSSNAPAVSAMEVRVASSRNVTPETRRRRHQSLQFAQRPGEVLGD